MRRLSRHCPYDVLILAVVMGVSWCGLIGAAVAKHKAKPDLYSKAVNDTLDCTLQVGSEWRTANRSFTWQELQVEVAHRLRVKRTEPWNR